MDGAVCAVDSEQGLVANPFRCLLGVDYRGEAVFAGQDCGVAELAALVGDDGGDFPLKWARMRLAMVYTLGRVVNCV